MLFLLPGLGANHKMYTESDGWDNLANVSFLDWPQYDGETTIKEVAERLIKEHGISSDDFLGGSCLGGMVALEIYRILNNRKVFLLGSAINKSEINSLLIKLSPLAKITPLKLIQVFAGKYQNKLAEMFTESKFIKSMCSAINGWEGYSGPKDDIIRIHGKKDMIIKCPENCFSITNGGHFIAMTHSKECIRLMTCCSCRVTGVVMKT